MIVGIDATLKSLSKRRTKMKELKAIEQRFDEVLTDVVDYVSFLEDETDELKRLFSMVKKNILTK